MNAIRNRPVFLLTLAALCFALASGPALAERTHDTTRLDARLARLDLPAPVAATDFLKRAGEEAKVELGQLLFFDKILSGNRNISCATCHHPMAFTADGLSLSVGEGGTGLAVARDTGRGADRIHERVPRNAPAVFNLGAREFQVMFHDGRVAVDKGQPSGFLSPAGDDLPLGLDGVLAAQAMFPVTSGTEMAGQAGENEVADAAAAEDLPLVWELLAARLRSIPEYAARFADVFDDVSTPSDITYAHAANAIAAFEDSAWRATGSPYDRYLKGEKGALSRAQKRGMRLFYGELGCSDCHTGKFQTDHSFHAICVPQIGPGKGDGADGREDFGRERVTGDSADRYKFRTPSLRNVALTGPWGHDGAFNSLKAMVVHHFDPVNSIEGYDPSQAVLPSRPDLDAIDFVAHSDPEIRAAMAEASDLEFRHVKKRQKKVRDLVRFLYALTDPESLDLRSDVPRSVPSGLPIAD